MLFDKKPYTIDSIVRLGILVALIYGLVWLLGYLSDVLIPFAVALLLAYLINPIVTFVQKKIGNRLAAVLITLIFMLGFITLLVWILVPIIVSEITHMGTLISNLVTKSDMAEMAAKRLPPDIWQAIKDYIAREEVQAFFKTDNFIELAKSVIQRVLPGIWGLITGTASVLLGLLVLALVGLYLIFLLLDFQKVRHDWKDIIPEQYREPVLHFLQDFNAAMKRHFRSQALIAGIVGVLFATGFVIIGLPMGLIVGLFMGLLNMIPYLQALGFLPVTFMALMQALETGRSFWVVFGLACLVVAIVQTIQDTLLVPKIQGKTTGLSPAMIVLSLSIWGKLLGFLGLLLALPLTFLLRAYYRRFLAKIEMNIDETVKKNDSCGSPEQSG
ncbi:AI-2E family transporter [candidate division KSB1 bacterium]|nr:AI-2E family transporter [candidate division KSB1 bacterium]